MSCAKPSRAEKIENVMGRAGTTRKLDGPGRAAAHQLKTWWAGPGRGPPIEKFDGRRWAAARPRPAHQRRPITRPGFSDVLLFEDI